MYSYNDKLEKIRTIQRYLSVTESGNYDEKTIDAVRRVQARANISENGVIDYATFKAIYDEYKKKMGEKNTKGFEFPINPGDYNDGMREINRMLISLSSHYAIQTNLKESDYYGERSERILRELYQIYSIDKQNYIIDADLYIRLKKDLDSIKLD